MRVNYRNSENANMIRQAVTFQAKDEQRVGPKTEANRPDSLLFVHVQASMGLAILD